MPHKLCIILFLSFFLNNAIYAQQDECPQFEWVETSTHNGGAQVYAVNKDKNDNLYIVFNLTYYSPTTPTSRTISFANLQFTVDYGVKEQNKLLIVKLDKNLKLLWKNEITLTRDSTFTNGTILTSVDIAFDANGNPYVSGNYMADSSTYTLSCNNKSLSIESNIDYQWDGFLLKLNRENGNAFWIKQMEGVRIVNTTSSVSSHFYIPFVAQADTLIIDNMQYTGVMKKSGIARFNALGELQWVSWGGTDTKYKFHYFNPQGSHYNMNLLDVDNQDNIYTTGLFDKKITKLDSLGQIKWQREFPELITSGGQLNTIHIDKSGRLNMIITPPSVQDTFDFGNGDTVYIGQYGSCFFWQIDPSNGHTMRISKLWDLLPNTRMEFNRFTSDLNGYYYLSGGFWSKDSIRMGDSIYRVTPYPDTNDSRFPEFSDAFITKIELPAEGSGNATFLWTLQSKGTAQESAQLFNSSEDGTVHYISGRIWYTVGVFGHHILADTFRDSITDRIYNRYNFYVSKINTDCSIPTEEITNPLQSVTIYPNPASTQLTISNLPLKSTINITDLSGRVLYTQQNKLNSLMQIPINGFRNGMYFVEIINKENRINRKVVVVR